MGGIITPPSDIAPPLRADFFNATAAILLRPLPPPDQDHTSSGRGGTYKVIARLLPLFEQHAPDKATALRAQLAALAPDTPEDARDPRDGDLTRPGAHDESEARQDLAPLDHRAGFRLLNEIYTRAAPALTWTRGARELAENPTPDRNCAAYLDFDSVARASAKGCGRALASRAPASCTSARVGLTKRSLLPRRSYSPARNHRGGHH